MKFTDFKPSDRDYYRHELSVRGFLPMDVPKLIKTGEASFRIDKSANDYPIGILTIDDAIIHFIPKYAFTFESTPDGDKLLNGIVLKDDMWNGEHYTVRREDGETHYIPITYFLDSTTDDCDMFTFLGYIEEVY